MDELLEHFKKNKTGLYQAIKVFEKDPATVRNMIAEKGTEVTPQQLQQLVDMTKDILEKI